MPDDGIQHTGTRVEIAFDRQVGEGAEVRKILWVEIGGREIHLGKLAQELRKTVTDRLCGKARSEIREGIIEVLNAALFQPAVDDWEPQEVEG